MSHDVIEAELKKDTTSWSAQYYFDNYNTDGRLSSASQVPRYIYTCLVDLLTGFGTTNLTVDQLIVAEYGMRKVPSSPCIIIQPTYNMEPYMRHEYVMEDTIGAESTYINILVKNVFNNTDYYRVRDIGLRVRYILDSKMRGLENNQFMIVNNPSELDPSVLVDNSLDPTSAFKMQWEQSGLIETKEWAHRFCCAYVTYFN